VGYQNGASCERRKWGIWCCWNEVVVSALEHDIGKAIHEIVGLNMEVAETRVGFPATNKLDNFVVDLAIQKCHGARSSKRFCSDISGQES
jgi:predicted HD phosphohydrolase